MSTTISQPVVSVSYYILAYYFYYPGTYNVPDAGALRDQNGDRIEFASRELAQQYLTRDVAMNCREFARNQFTHAGIYYLTNGEYSSPGYTIRKVPVRD